MNLTFLFRLPLKNHKFSNLDFSSVHNETYTRDKTFQMQAMDQNLEQQSNGTEPNNEGIATKCSEAGTSRNHFQVYSDKGLKKCNRCDYASSRASDLRTHLKTHSGERPYKCSQCDYASSEPSNLRTHLKTHSG